MRPACRRPACGRAPSCGAACVLAPSPRRRPRVLAGASAAARRRSSPCPRAGSSKVGNAKLGESSPGRPATRRAGRGGRADRRRGVAQDDRENPGDHRRLRPPAAAQSHETGAVAGAMGATGARDLGRDGACPFRGASRTSVGCSSHGGLFRVCAELSNTLRRAHGVYFASSGYQASVGASIQGRDRPMISLQTANSPKSGRMAVRFWSHKRVFPPCGGAAETSCVQATCVDATRRAGAKRPLRVA